MIKKKVDADDVLLITKKFKKISKHTFFFNLVVFIFILILFEATKNQLHKFYIILLDVLIFGVWILNCVISTFKLLSVKRKIKNGTAYKIEEKYTVIDKDYYSFDLGDDYYLKLKSIGTNKKKKISVSKKEFHLIKVDSTVVLTLVEDLGIILEARYNDIKLENP